MQTVLKQYPLVMWVDSSVRFRTSNLSRLIEDAVSIGVQVSLEFNSHRVKIEASVAERTDLRTFQYLGEDPCLFQTYGEVHAGWVFLYRSIFTLKYIMKPWVSCALHYGCMVITRATMDCDSSASRIGKCHRFDQSVLGIILTRLFNVDRYAVHFRDFYYGKIMRGDVHNVRH